jgi:hypothetical protein
MICADSLAGANLEGGDASAVLLALDLLLSILPSPQKLQFPRWFVKSLATMSDSGNKLCESCVNLTGFPRP